MAKKKQAKVVNTSGKRKTAIARATVKMAKKGVKGGRVRVNSEPIEILQPEMARNKAMEPLKIANAMNRLDFIDINVNINIINTNVVGDDDHVATSSTRTS